MIPPCGPGNVLWVLPIITSAPSFKGCWNCPPAIRPKTCAPSYMMVAPTSSAASRASLIGCGNKNKLPPNKTIFGFSAKIFLFIASMSMFITFLSNGWKTVFNPRIPAALTSAWEMWPPEGTSRAITFSPGFAKPKNAARFAVTPETGWTLAYSQS